MTAVFPVAALYLDMDIDRGVREQPTPVAASAFGELTMKQVSV